MKRAVMAILMGSIGLARAASDNTQAMSNIILIQADRENGVVLQITQQAQARGIVIEWVADHGDIVVETNETATLIALQRETVLPVPRSPLLHPLNSITLTIPTSDTIETVLWAIAYLQGNCTGLPNKPQTRLLWLHCQLAMSRDPTPLESISPTDDLEVQAVGWWNQLQQGQSDPALETLNLHLHQPHAAAHRSVQLLSYRASIYASRFEYDLAVQNLETALQHGQATLEANVEAKLHKQLGDTLLLLYEWDRVLDHYNEAISLSPAFADAYWARGMLYYTKGASQSALNDFHSYLRLSPSGYYNGVAQRAIEEIERALGIVNLPEGRCQTAICIQPVVPLVSYRLTVLGDPTDILGMVVG